MNIRKKSEKKNIGVCKFTDHAQKRLRQRALTKAQIELVVEHGEPMNDGYVMTKRAINERIAELKREIKLVERLSNIIVVDLGGSIITVYRAREDNIRRKLRT